jgi:hypothetical protein
MHSCRLPASVIFAAVVLAGVSSTSHVAHAGQPPAFTPTDDRQVTVKTADDVARRRQALIDFIWGAPGMPARALPTVERNDKSPVGGLTDLARVDTLIVPMEAGKKGYAHHFIPNRPNARLVVLHHGHASSFNDDPTPEDLSYGMRRTIDGLLTDGYSVLAVYMPHVVKFSTRLTVDDHGKVSHDDLFKQIKLKHGSPMKFFLEPVAVCLHYLKTRSAADDFPEYRDFSMAGLSGGGWTTVVYAAIDPTIRLSFPVAGSMPLYLWPRNWAGYTLGDGEQTLAAFYRIAGYPDLYVLGSHGPGRRQVHVLNRLDDCCFGEGQHKDRARELGMTYDEAVRGYESQVRLALQGLGSPSSFRVEIDESVPLRKPYHRISPNALVNTILAELNGGRPSASAASSADAFVRGTNGHLWHFGRGGWKDTGIPMVGAPTVVRGAVNDFDVFYRNPRNEPMHAYPAGREGWKQRPLGGVVLCDPVAVSTAKGRIDVVAFGRSRLLYHWRLTDDGVSPYELVKGSEPGLGNPALVSSGPKRLDVFYRGLDRTLRHAYSTGDPAPWKSESLGGVLSDFPTAVALPDGSLRAYVRDPGGRLLEAAQANPAAPWRWTAVSDQTSGQLIAGSPSASIEGNAVRVHARTPANGLGTFTFAKEWSFANQGGSITGSPTSIPEGAFARGGSGGLLFHDITRWFNRAGALD